MNHSRGLSKIVVSILIVMMTISAIGPMKAKAANNYLVPANSTGRFDLQIEPGDVRHYLIPVKADNDLYNFKVQSLSADCSNANIKISNISISDPSSASQSSEELTMWTGHVYNLEFDVTASDSINIGYNTLSFYGSGQVRINDGVSETLTSINNELLLTLTSYTATELKPIELVVDKVSYNEADVYPGNKFTLKLTVKNTGERQALNAYLSMNFGDSGIIPDYKVESIKIGGLQAGKSTVVDVPVEVLKTANPGFYSLTATITCKDNEGVAQGPFTQNMYITVNKVEEEKPAEKDEPVIELSTPDNYKVLTPDAEVALRVVVKNSGKADAKDVNLVVKSGLDASSGITKAFTTEAIKVGDLKAGEEKTVAVPVRVAKNIAAGLYEIQMEATYKNDKNEEKTSASMTMYVKGPDAKDPSVNKNGISIANVSQSPENPKAGENVTVSFDVINDGNGTITNVKISGSGLSSTGFEPVSSEPYKKVSSIGAGSKARVSMTFKVGKNIPEGFNTLNINIEYTDSTGMTGSDSAALYILNVENEEQGNGGNQKNSRPKLIINQYSAEPVVDYEDVDEFGEPIVTNELKAGKVFCFKYSIKNTHAFKAAKNIKLTLEQSEAIFSPVEGSNIFYIDQIPAGETVEQEVYLKTRNDVATGDYNISIKVEYEYDDMSEADAERGGVTDENQIKLHAVENYRPEIENIYIEAYDGVYVGMPVDLSFEFYNMGKSTLGNVYVTIEGDFELANNSTKTYVGAVPGYGQEYVNPQIVPLVSGEATGIVVVHFEDSNGEEQIKTAEFTTYVMGGDDGDWDMSDYGDYGNMSGNFYTPDYDGENWGDMEDEGEEGTKILGLPVWLFIVICASIVVIVVVVIIIIVKKKHKKALLDEDDE